MLDIGGYCDDKKEAREARRAIDEDLRCEGIIDCSSN